MISRIHGAGLALFLAMFLAGCQEGAKNMSYDRGDKPEMTTALVAGDYALYTENNHVPTLRIVQPLHKGDKFGFEKSSFGRLQAVAGSFRTNLDPMTERAYWKLDEHE